MTTRTPFPIPKNAGEYREYYRLLRYAAENSLDRTLLNENIDHARQIIGTMIANSQETFRMFSGSLTDLDGRVDDAVTDALSAALDDGVTVEIVTARPVKPNNPIADLMMSMRETLPPGRVYLGLLKKPLPENSSIPPEDWPQFATFDGRGYRVNTRNARSAEGEEEDQGCEAIVNFGDSVRTAQLDGIFETLILPNSSAVSVDPS